MFWAVIGALFIGFFLGVMLTYGSSRERYTNWQPISIKVVSLLTNEEYHADRYKYSMDDTTPYLRIYNGKKFEWLPIWHFKNPYLIMLTIDPDYAKDNMLNLFSVGSVEKLTKANKK